MSDKPRRSSSISPSNNKKNEDAPPPSLVRDRTKGMNAVSLLTGYYGPRGERIRHVVHKGALQLPAQALELYESVPAAKDLEFELPGLDAVKRPSRDPSNDRITVTDVYGVVIPADPLTMRPPVFRSVAKNRVANVVKPVAEAERMRGGGEGDVPMNEQTSSSTPAVPSSASGSQPTPAPAPSARTEAAAPAPTSSSSQPPAVTSSSTAPTEPQVVALKKRPAPQWSQHVPGPHDEMQVDPGNKTPKPDWYDPKGISELEKTVLPEWFDGSGDHRTPESYVQAREKMMEMSDKLSNRYVTATMVRRAIPGDVGSLMRLHSFLTAHALINDDAMNDSAPTPIVLQEDKSKYRWSVPMRSELLHAVMDESRKRPKVENPHEFVPIDWQAVADTIGHGASAKDCERQFLAMPINEANLTDRAITPDGPGLVADDANKIDIQGKLAVSQEVFQELIDKSDPQVVTTITKAALRATKNNIEEAQRAGLVALVKSQAVEEATSEEAAVAHVLSEIVDLRMKKLENRLTLLDDIEGMLEAERVALELERRDLYTARCRHWFGGP